jgi:hypothetical protein
VAKQLDNHWTGGSSGDEYIKWLKRRLSPVQPHYNQSVADQKELIYSKDRPRPSNTKFPKSEITAWLRFIHNIRYPSTESSERTQ